MIAKHKKLAQKEYKQRLDNIARNAHLKLCQKFGLVGEVKWYNHKPASVVEDDRVKILWDFNIHTDHVLDKTERKCHLVDVAMPGDKRIELKEQEKIDNYSELRWEVKKIWNLSQVVVAPIGTGALGVTLKKLKHSLKKLDVKSSIKLFQKAALLGTAKIVRQVLDT